MDTPRECICCQEIKQIKDLLDCDLPLNCIAMHLDFANACLSRTVLTIPFHGYRHHYGSSDVPSDEAF